MNPKVSILVPIYSVSQYIEKCAISLFEQTFHDIEFIFVNDATPDDSMEKLQKVIENFPDLRNQIRIIHQKINKGLAATRNIALDASQGDYIAVIDSDDYIDRDMIEILYAKAIESNSDIVVSDIIFEYNDHETVIHEKVPEYQKDYFSDMILNDHFHGFLCNKLIRRNLYILPECRVPEGLNYFEDRYVMTRLCYFAEKISKVDKAFYHYVQYNSNAITKTKNRMHFENVIRFWNDLDNFLKVRDEFIKYKSVMELPKVQSKINLFIDTHSSQLRKDYRDLFFEEETNCIQYFKRGEKLMLLLVRYRMFAIAQLFHIYLIFRHKKLLNKQ